MALQQLAKAATLTYPDHFVADLHELASLGAHGNSEQNCQRDLLLKLHDVIPPEPYVVDAPLVVIHENKTQIMTRPVSLLLPHEWFACLCDSELMEYVYGSDKIEAFWSQARDDDPRLFENNIKFIAGWVSKTIPFLLHGDGAPHQKKTVSIFCHLGAFCQALVSQTHNC